MSNKQDKNCIFCKIIKKEIPSDVILENKDFIAILDINPVNKGHILILIKDHCKNLTDFPEDKGKELIIFAKKNIMENKELTWWQFINQSKSWIFLFIVGFIFFVAVIVFDER